MDRPGARGANSVDAYLRALDPVRRRFLERIRSTIRAAAPGAEETISYGMPAFRYHGPLVYYAAFRDHFSLFVGSPTARTKFARELSPFAGGKGTVRFTSEDPLPMSLLRRIVQTRVRENEERAAAKARPRPGSRSAKAARPRSRGRPRKAA